MCCHYQIQLNEWPRPSLKSALWGNGCINTLLADNKRRDSPGQGNTSGQKLRLFDILRGGNSDRYKCRDAGWITNWEGGRKKRGEPRAVWPIASSIGVAGVQTNWCWTGEENCIFPFYFPLGSSERSLVWKELTHHVDPNPAQNFKQMGQCLQRKQWVGQGALDGWPKKQLLPPLPWLLEESWKNFGSLAKAGFLAWRHGQCNMIQKTQVLLPVSLPLARFLWGDSNPWVSVSLFVDQGAWSTADKFFPAS